nr:Integrase core domain [Klebsiella pneumoniae]
MALRFAPSETTRAYMETLRDYLDKYGRPLALYSDRHSIFRVNNPEREGELTQFTRAIKTLGIEPIHANSPQAKGRVERANQTLQDRLVKELRLRNISDIETANLWLSEFVKDYNSRFASIPVKMVTPTGRFFILRKNLTTYSVISPLVCFPRI